MNLLVLDVDGVLNRCGKSNQGLETDKVKRLGRIIEECNPDILISSTWRFGDWMIDRLLQVILPLGANVVGATPIHPSGSPRGGEIQEWLDIKGYTPDRMVILDDDDDMAHLAPHLVRTESFIGLTDEIADEVIRRLT